MKGYRYYIRLEQEGTDNAFPHKIMDGDYIFEPVEDIGNMDVMRDDTDERYYDLQWRIVANPRSGIYIYKGKKIIL